MEYLEPAARRTLRCSENEAAGQGVRVMSKKVEPDFGSGPGPALHEAHWRFGEFELDERRRELRRLGELLVIEPKPLNLLMLMLRHPGELITKNDLIEALWPGRIVTEAVLGNCVAKLRGVLGPEAAGWIKTLHGYGYRFDTVAALVPDEQASIAAPRLSLSAGEHFPARPNWQLVRRLGRSGDSWLAEHSKTRARRVFKFTAEPHGLSALKREVTIFRLLRESLGDKVCYVELLDWNFDAPPWFIEAEYCPAGSLEEWFEAQGGVSKVPLATRLDLVAQIAEALAAVHVIGVLHKDLKPANVFIVLGEHNRPEIRLADFGSGRLLRAENLQALQITHMGFTQVIDSDQATSGTPLYLAPEVLNGQPATVKADIYALGVMLYQCAVGNLRRPLAAGWEQDIDDEMLRDDIAAAAEGNPERRLADAGELARSLRGIEQRRVARNAERAAQARAEREARALERMRARRLGLRLAFAALAIGFVVSAALYLDARQARNVAQAETRRAEKVAAFLGEDMFKAVNTDDHPVKDLTVKQLLDSAAAAVETRFKDEPDIAAQVYESLGRSYNLLEYGDEAQLNIERALNIHEQRDGIAADATLALTEEMVGLKYPIGQLPATIEHYEDIERAGERRLGAVDPRILRLRVALARGHVQLGQWQRGATELDAVLSQLLALPALDSLQVILVERALAYVQIDLARYDEAERHLRNVIERATKIRGEKHLDVARAHMSLGRVMYETGRYEKSDAELSLAMAIARDWNREDGSIVLTIRLYEAWLRLDQGRPDEAVAILEDIKKTVASADAGAFDQSFTEDRPLALAYERLGRLDRAEKNMEHALSSSRKSLGESHPLTQIIRAEMAGILLEKGASAAARSLLISAPAINLDDLPLEHPFQIELRRVRAQTVAGRNPELSRPTELGANTTGDSMASIPP
ncbi:MAG: hypothetical protein NVS9B10_17120 [Nevskia sp.]